MTWFAKRIAIDGISFDSHKEAARFQELKLLQLAGEIAELEVHPVYVLAEAVVVNGRKKPALTYRPDFRYRDARTGEIVVEDVKGSAFRTAVYRVKKHLLKAIHGIEVVEVV